MDLFHRFRDQYLCLSLFRHRLSLLCGARLLLLKGVSVAQRLSQSLSHRFVHHLHLGSLVHLRALLGYADRPIGGLWNRYAP